MEVTQATRFKILHRKNFITETSLDKTKVDDIRTKQSTDIDGIRLYDAAMRIKQQTQAVEASLRALQCSEVNRVSTPNMVVVIEGHDANNQKLTGGAKLAPTEPPPTEPENSAPPAVVGTPTEMRALVQPNHYTNHYYFIGTAESEGKTIGSLHRILDGSTLSEAVFRTDGSISVARGQLSAGDLAKYQKEFLPSVLALRGN